MEEIPTEAEPVKVLLAEDDPTHRLVLEHLVRKAGVMSIVLTGGEVRPGDAIEVELPAHPHRPLGVV